MATKKPKAAPATPVAAAPVAAAPAGPNMQVLSAIVTATNAEPHFGYFENDADVQALAALGFVEVRPDITGATPTGASGIATRATAAGQAALTAVASPFGTTFPPAPAPVVVAAPAPVVAPPVVVVAPVAPVAAAAPVAPFSEPSAFKIVASVALPAAKRFGKASVYPFDAMQPGNSFFVPATKDRPNPAKSMASTVNSATARYDVADGKNPDGSDKTKHTRVFALRRIEDGEAAGFGSEYKGVKGAGVWRTL